MPRLEEGVFLSVIVPAYNEETRLGDTLLTIRAFLESRIDPYGTGDGSPILLGRETLQRRDDRRFPAPVQGRLRNHRRRRRFPGPDEPRSRPTSSAAARTTGSSAGRENRGKGYSIREGMLAASGRLILFLRRRPVHADRGIREALRRDPGRKRHRHRLPGASPVRTSAAARTSAPRKDGEDLQRPRPAPRPQGDPRHAVRLQAVPAGGRPSTFFPAF